MNLARRAAFRLLRVAGYRLFELEDSWNVILAEPATRDIGIRSRCLEEYTLFSVLNHLLSEMGTSLVLDVGACQGRFARHIRKAGYRERIVSFEPNPELHASLDASSAGDDGWEIVHCGISDVPGDRSFHITEDRCFGSFYRPNDFAREQFGSLAAIARDTMIPARRLDDLLHDRYGNTEVPNFCLKTDTQGHDLRVYSSLGDLSAQCQIVLTEMPFRTVYEAVPSFDEMMAFFSDQGFMPVGFFSVSRGEDFSMIECDGLFLRTKYVK